MTQAKIVLNGGALGFNKIEVEGCDLTSMTNFISIDMKAYRIDTTGTN